MSLELAVKQKALEIGFDLVGVAPLNIGEDLERAQQWLEKGYGGEMRYLANPKRYDPRLILPSVKSVVCVGLLYNTVLPYSMQVRGAEGSAQKPLGSSQQGDDRGASAWISRYAWGKDYHDIARAKLELLRTVLEDLVPDVETRIFVDTGPIIERAFARHSGIGWMGKNTCIINERKGSWFFLGVLLTSLELQPDPPAPDRCGSCTACLQACPTRALARPYVMDASRCISYLTIELKGSIPLEFRSAIGMNVFGCDICQDVCPWNSQGRSQESEVRSQESGFQPLAVIIPKLETGKSKLDRALRPPATQNGQGTLGVNRQPSIDNQQSCAPGTHHPTPGTFSLFNPPLEALASLTEEDFKRVFARSAIKRAKYRGWLRNLCVAMGNSGDARFVPKLRELSHYPDPVVREHAAWALGKLAAN